MPRTVDAGERRREIAEAVWRVIRREGVPGASVRTVAREAGTSMGSLRHWFATQDELLSFAMTLVSERARERLLPLVTGGSPGADWALRVLEEVLPLDDERRVEAEVWLALAARALVDPRLAALRDRSTEDLAALCTWVLERLAATGGLRAGLDLPLEAERLFAVLDGLAVHVLTRPATLPPARVREVLAVHLRSLRDAP